MKRVEISLADALDINIFPISLTTSQTCLLSESIVFEAGFEFTVLQRKNVWLLFGTDWHGKRFRLNTAMLTDLYVDIVDEFYPTNLKEIQEIIPNISYILCKTTKSIEFFRLDEHETFSDLKKIVLITSSGHTIHQSLDSLLNKDRFVFVHCKKTMSFIELLSNNIENGTVIRFINGFDCQVPTGTVVMNGVYAHDSILIVSELLGNHNKLLYQIFLLDSVIKVFFSEKPLPLEVVEFGNYGSATYISRIKEIMFSIFFDVYSPLYYGQLIVDISFRNEVKKEEENPERRAENNSNLKIPDDLKKKVKNKLKKISRPTTLFSSSEANNYLNKQSISLSNEIEETLPCNNVTINQYGMREQTIERKNSIGDSGIDSPNGNEVFEQESASSNCNDTNDARDHHNLNFHENVLKKPKGDKLKKALKIKHSKRDTKIYYLDKNVNTSRLPEEVYSGYMSINDLQVQRRRLSSVTQNREIESLEEISACSEEDLSKILHDLQLSKFVNKFKKEMITGRILANLPENALIEIGFSHFEARKLHKYVHGWRVNILNCCENLEDASVTNWSVCDVKKVMKKLKLHRLGAFAVKNQVDGDLLEDLIKNDYIKTLKNDHGIGLTIIETLRLCGYVYKQIEYKD